MLFDNAVELAAIHRVAYNHHRGWTIEEVVCEAVKALCDLRVRALGEPHRGRVTSGALWLEVEEVLEHALASAFGTNRGGIYILSS
jgi:hypothetical protein